jgi:hypothetical protein
MKLKVFAKVRYWEDGKVNGVEDETGELIPFRVNDSWCPTIEVETGRVLDWPSGMTADVYYKVCDEGEYFLVDDDSGDESKKWKYKSNYVPDDFLCHGDEGDGDYIILKIDGEGQIVGYKQPVIRWDEWVELEKNN